MSTATTANTTRKRVRINDVIDVDDTSQSTPSHSMAVNLYTGALVSLQPAIRTVADVFFKKLTDIYKVCTTTKDKLKKFNDNEDFIPRSCRINFQLGASNFVKGSTKFMELQAKVDANNKQVAIKNRDYIVDAIILEVKATTEALRNTFCDCLFKLSRLFLQSSYFDEEIPDNDIHTLSKTIIMSDTTIIKYIFDNNATDFRNFYNKKYNITARTQFTLQPITELLPNGSRNIADYNFTEGEQASYEYAEHLTTGTGLEIILAGRRQQVTTSTNNTYVLTDVFKNQYRILIHRMVNLHWSAMINLHYNKLIDAKLTKLATTLITADDTNDVAMIVAAQPPASEAIISDLINQKFNDFKRTFKSELLADQKTKNNQRGETTTRAAPKKSTNTKQTPKKKSPTPKSPPASKTKSTKKATTSAPPPKKGKKQNSAGGAKQDSTKGKKSPRPGKQQQRTTTTTPRRSKSKSKSNQRPGTNK
jgi:hypothetical protein